MERVDNSASSFSAGQSQLKDDASNPLDAPDRTSYDTSSSRSKSSVPHHSDTHMSRSPLTMRREQVAVSASRTYPETRPYRQRGVSSTNAATSLVSHGSLRNLRGGDPGLSIGRGGTPLKAYNYFEDSIDVYGNGDEEDDDDDNICPSMLFSCFPCFGCLR